MSDHIQPDAAMEWHLAANENEGDMCAVYAADGEIVAEYVMNRSHARLIAAAPKLLALVRSMASDGLHKDPDDFCRCSRCDRIRLARAAIAETTIDDTPNINQLREVLP